MINRSTICFVICSFLGMIVLNTSCQKESIYDPNKVEKTANLKIPAGFDWTTTRTVKLSVSSEVNTLVFVYLDKSCSADQLLARLPLSPEAQEVTVTVPKNSTEVYVQYPVKDGQTKVAGYSLNTQTKSADIQIKLPEDAVDHHIEGGDKYYIIYGSGNIMFEDNWPDKGDYDFNDFVIRYKTENRLSLGGGDYEKEGMTVKVDFVAMGGAYPYHLGLQLDKLPAAYVDSYEVLDATGGITAEFVNPGEDTPAVFIFKGCEDLKGKDGAEYFNTEKGYITTDPKLLPSVTFRIKVNCFNHIEKDAALKNSGIQENQNFFLQIGKNGNKEIHLRGYEPTHFYQQNYEKDAQGKMSDIKYCNADGFVWGIKVAWNTPYPYEKVDVLKAFPIFQNWVTSNGMLDYASWFKAPNYNRDLVVEIQ